MKKYQESLDALRKRYGRKARVSLRMVPADFLELVGDDCPPNLLDLKNRVAERPPTHVILRPAQMEALLQHAANREQADHPSPDVSGLSGDPADVDDQA